LRGIGVAFVSDGTFPHHLPDPEDPANMEDLRKKVVASGADIALPTTATATAGVG
jgi:phosphomannomutase